MRPTRKFQTQIVRSVMEWYCLVNMHLNVEDKDVQLRDVRSSRDRVTQIPRPPGPRGSTVGVESVPLLTVSVPQAIFHLRLLSSPQASLDGHDGVLLY